MGRPDRTRITRGPGLILTVASLLVSVCLSTAADEPTSKGGDAKPVDPKKIEAAAKQREAALKVAESYLILVDKGKYADSWEAHTSEVRNGIPRQKWVDALNKARKPFGRLLSRKLNRMEMRASENPERIDQAWVYSNLVFQNGRNSGELVVVYFEKGKEWKVSGYYIGDPDTLPKAPVVEKQAGEDDDGAMKAEEKTSKKTSKSAKK
jgi:Protein of unknown function (DUF4019)